LKHSVIADNVYCLQASALPLSIIIVGIGGADFEGLCSLTYFVLRFVN